MTPEADYYSSNDTFSHSEDDINQRSPLLVMFSRNGEGQPSRKSVTVAHIVDCPMITVHAGKHCKVLIDSGAAISLLHYCTYQSIGDSFKTPLQLTTAKLNTADGSPMTVIGMTALHLWIADFKFTHNFVICDRLMDTEIIFGIDIQKTFSLSYAWDKEKKCYIQRDSKFLTCMPNCEQKATMGMVRSTLKDTTTPQWCCTN